MIKNLNFYFILLLNLFILKCGDDKKGPIVTEAPEIRIKVNLKEIDLKNPQIVIDEGLIGVGEVYPVSIYILDAGSAPLKIYSATFDYTPPQGSKETENDKAFSMEHLPTPFEIAPMQKGKEYGLAETAEIKIKFKRFGDSFNRIATLTIKSNTYEDDYKTIKITITTTKPYPKMEVIPAFVDFGLVKEGEFAQKDIVIMNNGSDVLNITGLKITGDTGFTTQLNEIYYKLDEDTKKGINFNEIIKISPKGSKQMTVKYSPTSAQSAQSFIYLFNNDPEFKDGYKIEMRANMGGPCILVNPTEVNFGSVVIATIAHRSEEIQNCGEDPLEIYKIALSETSSKEFSLDLSPMGLKEPPTKENPFFVQIGEVNKFYVNYSPLEEKKDVNGKPLQDTGEIIIESNTYQKMLKIPVKAFPVGGKCPVAEITVKKVTLFDGIVEPKKIEGGIEVKPQSIIFLSGKNSFDPTPGGMITEYEWNVSQPPLSKSNFFPSSSYDEPQFECNISGDYFFRLKVKNNFGLQSCNEAEVRVFVKAGEGLHIELLWHTPKDPDETDQGQDAGADLDLHFVHPYAGGPDIDKNGEPDGYFDVGENGISGYDCFWFNAHPDWGIKENFDDDPNLDRDDTDGGGPENLNIKKPEDGKTYKFGIHYWDDHGFGVSYATVKIYIDGWLFWQKEKVKMKNLDMWEVGTIKFPSPPEFKEILINGAPKIIPNYVNPNFTF